MTKRYKNVDLNTINEMSKPKYSKNTLYSNISALNNFESFAKEFYPNYNLEDLPGILKHFYLSINTQKGESYKVSSLNQIKYALRRQFQEIYKIDIVNDPEFKECNTVFKNVVLDLKKDGKGDVHHFQDLTVEDCEKIVKSLDIYKADHLQLLTFFI